MNTTQYKIYIQSFYLMEVFISDNKKSNWILSVGDQIGWKWISQVPHSKNKKSFNINEDVFNYILKINPYMLHYINSSKTIYELFEKWGLYDMIGEELI